MGFQLERWEKKLDERGKRSGEKNGEEKKRGYVWKDGKREKIGDRRGKGGYSEKDAVQMKEAQGRSPPFQEPL